MPDLRTLLGDRYAPALQAAVLADNPEAITSEEVTMASTRFLPVSAK